MPRLYNCIAEQHDLLLVAVAAAICVIGSHTSFMLLRIALGPDTRRRAAWSAATALTMGTSVWATHFVAMLAFEPGVPSAYEPGRTAASLLVPVAVAAVAFGLVLGPSAWRRLAAGGLFGLGAAAMHYIGMSAYRLPGDLLWDTGTVAASIGFGLLLPMAAVLVGTRRAGLAGHLLAVALMALGISALHFVGMSAVTVLPDPGGALPEDAVSPDGLAVAVGGSASLLLLLSLAAATATIRDRRRARDEAGRMRSLADATVEGLLICDGPRIVACNRSFRELAGCDAQSLVGRAVDDVIRARADLAAGPEAAGLQEAELVATSGEVIPVELVRRPVNYDGRTHDVVAIRDLRDRRRAEERIRFLAHHDPLTRLPNRVGFAERMERELGFRARTGEQFAVLALDLDRFKMVNDTLGHGTGDALLAKVAARLRGAVRGEDLVCRLGGDEFAIVQFAPGQPEAAQHAAERLVELLARPFIVGGQVLNIGASVGIALYPADGTDLASLARNADLALYRAKSDGRGTFRFFEPEMDTRMQRRRMMEVELRTALSLRQFTLMYQPQLDTASGDIGGFEALVRWSHPERGTVSPADFIPLAEETGLIVPIGEWVLREACREAAGWPLPVTVSVNLSPLQVRSPGLVELVSGACAAAGLPPERLELEVTESVLLADSDATIGTLRRLKALGVRISMDDFGTGYSSLSYLRSFPFDKIKIDRSFVGGIEAGGEAAAIVRAIIGLGRSLGMGTTVEGVETAAQLDYLRAEGCDQIQGYLIGRPLLPSAARAALAPRLVA
ncbi:MAG: EAL domain-containing protein [Acetobacteraceae bacterium]|nr:EAL domain-containing protein [Acetobacteraceae bacterium]